MTTNQQPHITLEHPGELLASIPHLLGFHPVDSLVVLGLHGPSATDVGVVLRSDLPPSSEARDLAEYLLLPLAQHNAAGVVLIVVGGRMPADDLPHRELLARCESILVDGGYPVLHQLWTPDTAGGRRWQCYDDFDCGGVLPDPAGTELATVVADAGLVTYDRREDIVASLAPEPEDVLARRSAELDRLTDAAEPGATASDDPSTEEPPAAQTESTEPSAPEPVETTPPDSPTADNLEANEVEQVETVPSDSAKPASVEADGDEPVEAESDQPEPSVDSDRTRARLDAVRAAIAAAVATPPTLSDADVIRLAKALSDHRIRDTCLDFDELPDVAAAERLWTALARATPPPEGAEPACLLAFSAYARGDGVLAGIALTRAEAADPGHRLSSLLRSALTLGLAPGKIRIAGIRAATFARQALAKDLSRETARTSQPKASRPADAPQEQS
jgi:outer membrane biosynthesis protein TonB